MELKEYPSVERWLDRLAPSTADVNLRIFRMWVSWVRVNGSKFAEMSPDEWVEYQKSADNGSVYDVLDTLVGPYISQKEGTHSYLGKTIGTLRSFFLHNRAELPSDVGFKIRPSKAKVLGSLTIEEIMKVIYSSNPLYQAVFTSMFMGGMDEASFVYWNLNGYNSLMKQLGEYKNGNRMGIKVDIPGRKASKNIENFYTFIGRDAIDMILNYLPLRDPKDNPDEEAIFLTKQGGPVTKNAVYQYWYSHVKKLGLLPEDREHGERTGKNPHEMRDVFRSRWRISGVDVEVAEFFLGHDIDKLGYDKSPDYFPEWYEDQYNIAQPWLNILSEDPQKVSRREVDTQRTRIQELETQIERLGAGQGSKIDELTRALQEKDLIMAEVLKRLEYLERRE